MAPVVRYWWLDYSDFYYKKTIGGNLLELFAKLFIDLF
jgi:hypothetical protein